MSFCVICAKPVKPGYQTCFDCERKSNPEFAELTEKYTTTPPPDKTKRCGVCGTVPAYRRCKTCPDYDAAKVQTYLNRVKNTGRWTYLE